MFTNENLLQMKRQLVHQTVARMLILLQLLWIKKHWNKKNQDFQKFFILVGIEMIVQYYGMTQMKRDDCLVLWDDTDEKL